MEAGVNLLGRAGCRYTKEHVCKISGQYVHFNRSYDSFCNVRTFVLIYRPHPVEMQIIYDGRKVQVWDFASQGLNIGKWSTGKHCDGVAVVKKRENHYVSRRWHPSINRTQEQ